MEGQSAPGGERQLREMARLRVIPPGLSSLSFPPAPVAHPTLPQRRWHSFSSTRLSRIDSFPVHVTPRRRSDLCGHGFGLTPMYLPG